ncbi:hypothetical protein [uncultured Gilvimarinus sp.]|uniref:hypothetical protein n=1 Tax=uncultured Gilvimarinus sp. TaxID=1689143 RepID=UPI0030DAB707
MRAVIVASGPSASGFVPPKGVAVFAVNGAIDWLSKADHWFTLDPSDANMRRLCSPRRGVVYHAALPRNFVLGAAHVRRYERVSARGPEPSPKHTPQWWLWRWSAVCGLSHKVGRINTGNSAWGALQLAYQMGFKKILLVGVDASTALRVDGGAPSNLSHLPLLFESAMGQIDIVNAGGMQSRLPNMTIDKGVQWLKS